MATKTKSTSSRKAGASTKVVGSKWVIDISQPVEDKIMDGAAFEKFLQDKFKLEGGKPGQLGDKVKIAREGDARIVVSGNLPISKRYLKYLTKKYMKKAGVRDFLRVHATANKNEYKLSYLSTAGADEAADDSE